MRALRIPPSKEEQLETWTLHVGYLEQQLHKAEAEVARLHRKLIANPADNVYVQLLDEAERWLKRATHDYNGHKKVLDDMLAKRG